MTFIDTIPTGILVLAFLFILFIAVLNFLLPLFVLRIRRETIKIREAVAQLATKEAEYNALIHNIRNETITIRGVLERISKK